MRRFRDLYAAFVFTVFCIMMSTILFGGFLMFSFHKLGWLEARVPYRLVPFLLVVCSSVIIGTILSIIVSRKVLKPLHELIQATKEVSQGNYHVKVNIEHCVRSDLDELIDSFNHMVQELQGVEMMHHDFINNFSHEFKTPIVSIQGFAKQLQNDHLDEGVRKEYAQIIYKETKRLTHLSSNILLLTKLENQHILTNQTCFSLPEQLRTCILLLQSRWEEKELDLQLDLQEIDGYGNEEMLLQVWVNILDNAITYTPHCGVIRISCYRYGMHVKVKITNEGCVIQDHVMKHMFDKFYQGDSTHTAKGNGLGLTIAKRILELHDAQISVKSSPDKGTTCIVQL